MSGAQIPSVDPAFAEVEVPGVDRLLLSTRGARVSVSDVDGRVEWSVLTDCGFCSGQAADRVSARARIAEVQQELARRAEALILAWIAPQISKGE
jgi:hypothetical protein